MSERMYIPGPCIGRMLADAYDEEQAAALNEFGRLLILSCRGETKASTQLAYMADKMDKNGRWIVEELAEFCRIKEEREVKP